MYIFTNKNVRKKLKVPVAFLISEKLEGNWASSSTPFFLKIGWSKLRESDLATQKNIQILF